MNIKSIDISSVGSGNDCEIYITIICNEAVKKSFLVFFSAIQKQMEAMKNDGC
jgi:hypothetical protein